MEYTQEDIYLSGCLYAIDELRKTGSHAFAIKIDGKWKTIPWEEISNWIYGELLQNGLDRFHKEFEEYKKNKESEEE